MATTRFIAMHQNKGKSIAACIEDRTEYAKNSEKTSDGQYISSYECDPKTVQSEFLLSKRQYGHITGREQENNVIAYQIRQSFKPGEVTAELANKVGYELAMRFTKGNHAFIVATHIDKAHIHNHIIFNSTSLNCTKKFRDFLGSGKAVRRVSDIVCLENGLSIIENPKQSSKHYGKWLGDKKPVTHSNQIRWMIEEVMKIKPKDFEEFLRRIESQGYEVKRGKYVALKGQVQKKFIRLRSLGEGFSEEDIRAVINGEKVITRTGKKKVKDEKSVNLLVDIQTKLQAGKGAGYERWAKVFNLKQMAKTLNYLEENHITSLEVLERKVQEVNKQFQEVSEQIKASEKRMAEISVLQKHIYNYAKTKEIYVEYRKSGYSKKFYEEHVEELLLHKTAKLAFDKVDGKRIPKVKELREEYRRLVDSKSSISSNYRKMKQERKEISVIRANINVLLTGSEVKDVIKGISEREISSR
ncbi:MAG: relaxase/mobilization nuclease domain-containing protein [Mobilitalea sp.]